MKATQVLSDEHRVIERVLNSLETGANNLENGQAVRPEFFIQAAEFVKGFADGCHHQKEEQILFKKMQQAGMPVEGSPIGVMLAEHELGRQFIQKLRSAAQAMLAGDTEADQMAVQSAKGYVALLRQHIMKEDQVLFPMADKVIPADWHSDIWEDFEKVEHEEVGEGIHEKYLAIAEALEAEFSNQASS